MIMGIFKLPYGYKVTFSHSGQLNDGNVKAEWEPEFPYLKKYRARKKFLVEYDKARQEFIQQIANALGGTIMDVSETVDGDVVCVAISPEN